MRYGLWHRFKPTLLKEPKERRAYIVAQAEQAVWNLLPGRKIQEDELRSALDVARQRAKSIGDAVSNVTCLILQAPHAAQAQELMDQHPHGYHNKEKRLYELIDFNDAYVSSVLALPQGEVATFAEQVKVVMDRMCKRAHTRCFTNEQYDAIVHGLSREIAVYLGVKTEGYEVSMTNRTEDAFGIDMVIHDPHSGKSINVDVKARSAFHYRLIELQKEGRITNDDFSRADQLGYIEVTNGRDTEKRQVVIWRIDHTILGDVKNFRFSNTVLLAQELAEIIRTHGQ